jgi:hypothetical protein
MLENDVMKLKKKDGTDFKMHNLQQSILRRFLFYFLGLTLLFLIV